MTQQTQVIRWQGATQPTEQILRQQMQAQGLAPHAWSNGPGDYYAIHSHSYEKVLYCVSGSIRFILHDTVGAESYVDLAPGDCMILPIGVRHSAQVGNKGVTCIEAARYP